MRRFLALLLAVAFAPSAQAAPLSLGCSGTLTSTTIFENGLVGDPIQDSVDISVIIDFEKRAVLGFWTDPNSHQLIPIPIATADANAVTFNRGWKDSSFDRRISGTVDRINGKLDVREALLWRSGNFTQTTWDLLCAPADGSQG